MSANQRRPPTRCSSAATSMGAQKALPEHHHLAHALVGLADVALEQRRTDDAVVLARRAVTVREQSSVEAVERTEARFVLARALAQAGPSRAEAIASAAADRQRRVPIGVWLTC